MKKLLCLLMCVAMMFSLTGCENTGGGDDSGSGTGTLKIGIPGGNTYEQTILESLKDGFKEMYPDVKISFQYITIDNGAYGNGIQRLAVANNLPDIIWTNSPDIYEAYGYMESLDTYIEKSDRAGDFGTEGFANTFYTEYFDMGKVQGTRYVVPRSCDTVVAFYRTDWFKAAGVDMTKVQNGWTWDDLMDACAKLRIWMDDNGFKGSYCLEPNLTSWLSTCVPMLYSFGADVIDKDGKVVIDSDGTKATLNLLREMVEKRYIPDSQTTVSQGFEQGACPIYFQSTPISNLANKGVFKNQDGSSKIDLVSFPLIGIAGEDGTKDYSNAKIGAGIAGYCITKTSKNKDTAWAFLRYLLSKDGQQAMALSGLNLASIRKDLSDPTTANWGSGYENFNLSAYTYGSQYKVAPRFFEYSPISKKTDIDKAVTDLFVDGTNMKITLAKAIENCKKSLEDAVR